jgi:hypothetical protein
MADKRARKNEDEEQEKRNILPQDGREGPLDPYTGEVEPPAPDAYKVTEIVPTDPDNRKGENFLMDEEDSLDKFILDANTDEIMEQINDYTEDEEVLDDFAKRQGLATGGRQKLEEKLNEYNTMRWTRPSQAVMWMPPGMTVSSPGRKVWAAAPPPPIRTSSMISAWPRDLPTGTMSLSTAIKKCWTGTAIAGN